MLFIQCPMSEAGKLLPVHQIQPVACFTEALEQLFLHFYLGEKKSKEYFYFMIHENYIKLKFQYL